MLKFLLVFALATYSSVYGAGGGSHGSNSAALQGSDQDTETTKQMRVGKPLPLQCKIAADEDNKDEKIELKWFKEGKDKIDFKELTAEDLKEDGMTVFHENATLLINKAEEKHGGHYRCEASEFKPPRTFDVTVVYLNCKAMPKSMTFLQGDKMALTCDVAGNPMPTVVWHKDDVPVDEAMNISRYSLEENVRGVPNGTLIVLDAVDDDRATYKCLVASADITYETKTLVRIKGMYAALWPFLGICAEVLVLCVIIFVYEKRRAKNDFEESDTDQPNDQKPETTKESVRQRK